MKAILGPLRAVSRLSLALKYMRALGYSWHLAWAKAGY